MDSSQLSSFSATNNDIIVSLLSVPFSKRNESERNEIIKSGRPMPELNLQKVYKNQARSFHMSWYSDYKWLCSSGEKSKLFCWPCLLMSTKKGIWTSDGFDDLKNMSRSTVRHSASKEHLNACILLNTLSKSVVKSSELLLERTRIQNIKYNELVKKNREVVNVLIDVSSMICKQGLSIKLPDELKRSFQSDSFKAIFDLVIKNNSEVKQHCEKTECFRDVSTSVHHDLIECFYDELQNFINSELKQAAFFSCMVEGAGHVSGNKEVSIAVRLVDSNGKVQEYFLGFYEVEAHRTAQQLISVLCNVLGKFNMKQKLVALTYDGGCVAPSELNYFQTKIKEIVPQAIFPHNFYHSVNLILQQSCSTIKPVKEFFASLQGIPGFFHGSNRRTEILNRILVGFPTADEGLWDAGFEVINAVHTNRQALIEVFRQLQELSPDPETVRQCQYYLTRLKDFMFVFLLSLFNEIFEKTEPLRTAFKKMTDGTKLCTSAIMNCISYVRQQRVDKKCGEHMQTAEKTGSKLSESQNPGFYKQIYFEVLDNIITQLEFKYSSSKGLSFIKLGNIKKFPWFDREFPNDVLIPFLANYGSHFNQERLKTELEIIFSADHKDEFHNLNLKQLIQQLVLDDMTNVLPEAFRLFSLIATIPVSASGSSCQSRIKSYVSNAMAQYHSDAFASVYIDKNTLDQLEQLPSWYDDVISRFAQKGRPVGLLYRPFACSDNVMVSP